MSETKSKARRETVTLKQAHTHQRQDRKAGDQIDVPTPVAERLRKRGIAE